MAFGDIMWKHPKQNFVISVGQCPIVTYINLVCFILPAECADMWYKLSKDEKEKHIHVMKVYLLSPFLFGEVYQEDKVIHKGVYNSLKRLLENSSFFCTPGSSCIKQQIK